MEISDKPLLSKLGIKPGLRVAVLGFTDRSFMEDHPHDPHLESGVGYDVILFHAEDPTELRSLPTIKQSLGEKGFLWIVYPRGVKTITQAQVMFAGNAGNFTDTKVCRFSEVDTALKFMRRRKG
ncbi:MAG TPA: hypothetical protein VG944_03400 [Fimbriimonas sp.]|nr:hypothetical protein [Fimbriimonas sp.]